MDCHGIFIYIAPLSTLLLSPTLHLYSWPHKINIVSVSNDDVVQKSWLILFEVPIMTQNPNLQSFFILSFFIINNKVCGNYSLIWGSWQTMWECYEKACRLIRAITCVIILQSFDFKNPDYKHKMPQFLSLPGTC